MRPQGYRVIIFIKHAASLCLFRRPTTTTSARKKERKKDNLLRPIRTQTSTCPPLRPLPLPSTYLNMCVYNRISYAFLIPSPVSSSASTSKSLTEVERHPRWGCDIEPAPHAQRTESQRLCCRPTKVGNFTHNLTNVASYATTSLTLCLKFKYSNVNVTLYFYTLNYYYHQSKDNVPKYV